MPRLAQNDLAELRLRLRSSQIRSELMKRITFEDVENALEEIDECWDGNLPDWAIDKMLGNEDMMPLPHWAVKRIEESADRCEQIARALHAKGWTAAATVWREVEEELYELAEEIESDEGTQAEGQEERSCTDDHYACERGTRRAPCPDGGDPGRPASASRQRREKEAERR